jgi:hypothetical protein
MSNREAILARIDTGDIFHATSPNGASLICLALEVTDTMIVSQTVTSVYDLNFDRRTGKAERDFHGESVVCIIDSVAALPNDFKKTLIAVHRAYSSKDESGVSKLRDAEHRALVFAAQYFRAHPLDPPGHSWEMMSIGKNAGPPAEIKEYESLTREEKIDLILINFLIPRNQAEGDT